MKLTFDVPEEVIEKITEDINTAIEEYKKKQTWPQKYDYYYYYYIDSKGGIWADEYQDDGYDKGRLNLGNFFKTQEEAEFKYEQLRVLNELKQLADDDQPFDKDGSYSHVCIQYNWKHNKCYPTSDFRYATYAPFHFKSIESCQAAINKIGEERLKKYYFCIPEG